MTLKERLEADIKAAMLARDEFLKTTLRGLKSVVLLEEVAQNKRSVGLDEATIEALFAREVKQRDEAAVLFERGGNKAAADKERAEKVIIQRYLPEPLSARELARFVEAAIISTGATETKDIGRVIGAVKAEVGIAGDGVLIAKLVKEQLQK